MEFSGIRKFGNWPNRIDPMSDLQVLFHNVHYRLWHLRDKLLVVFVWSHLTESSFYWFYEIDYIVRASILSVLNVLVCEGLTFHTNSHALHSRKTISIQGLVLMLKLNIFTTWSFIWMPFSGMRGLKVMFWEM